ncbi:MAG: hypothetical protein C0392_11310 [Syntrophus sp. (in: bacteria)]|nr:hypothetical protein [Syntrophus sp. (in: bacteria)]
MPAEGLLVILGVIHWDENGPELLNQWMEAIRPQVITLEFSKYGMTFRGEQGFFYRQRIEEVYNRLKKDNLPCYDNALSMLLSYIEMPYEFEGASQYNAAHDVPLYLIDMDLFSYLRLRGIENLLSVANIERILSEDNEDPLGYEQALARLYFEKGVKAVSYTDEMYVRDRYMTNKIGVLKKYHRGRRFLHVAGWQHLQDPYNLYAPFKPIKVFSYDKALCI